MLKRFDLFETGRTMHDAGDETANGALQPMRYETRTEN
jgi:hypothetical protein